MSLEILIVDDDEDFLALMKRIFEVYKDAKVRDVSDSVQAVGLIDRQKFDGIFLDLNMPRIDGFQLATLVRASEMNKHTPIVVITAETDLESMRRVRAVGATFIITKPVDHKALKKIFDTTKGAMWAERRKRENGAEGFQHVTKMVSAENVVNLPPDKRRRHKRVRKAISAKITVGNQTFAATTKDASVGGLFLFTDTPLRPGADVEVVLMLPEEIGLAENRMVCCHGRIVRVETQGGRHGVAVQIEHMANLPVV